MNLLYLIIILYLIILYLGFSLKSENYNPFWKKFLQQRNIDNKLIKENLKFINISLIILTIFTLLLLYVTPINIKNTSSQGTVNKISFYGSTRTSYITYDENKIIQLPEVQARGIEVKDNIKVTETIYYNIFGKEVSIPKIKIDNLSKMS